MRRQHGVLSLRETVYTTLQTCLEKRDLESSREVYSLIIKAGLDSVAVLGDHLIRLFATCSSLIEAGYVFTHIPEPSLYTWNSIISAHIKLGQDQHALTLYHSMRILPDQVTFSNILKASINTRNAITGRCVHYRIVVHGISLDFVICGALVDFYTKLGTLEEASRVFHGLPHRDIVSWGAMIAGLQQHGHFHTSLTYLERMQHKGIKPNKVIFLLGLKACASSGALAHGMSIHIEVNKLGIEHDAALQSSLVDMYAKCGHLEEAQSVFERSDCVDLVLWSSIIGAYVHCLKHQLAFELYQRMLSKGFSPDKVVFLSLLQACSSAGSVFEGMRLHDEIIMKGLDSDMAIGNTLMCMYAKCGDVNHADEILHEMRDRDAVSWAAIISGYIEHGQCLRALELFANMQLEGFSPSKTVFCTILKGCGYISALEEGHLIHEHAIKVSLDDDHFINNTLVYMYSNCDRLEDAHCMFSRMADKDMVSWSSLISGYAEAGQAHEALNLLKAMQLEGFKPDKGILLCSLSACSSIGASRQGKGIHHLVFSLGVDVDTILATALVEMYVDCGTLQDAQSTFDCVTKPDAILWSALIAGYCEHGQASLAVRLIEGMQDHGWEPDQIAYLSLLRVCRELGAVDKGRLLHSQIVENQFDWDASICSTLLDMYIKFGNIEDAHHMFSRGVYRDLASWGAMVSGYALYGNSKLVTQCFKDMQQEGLKPSAAIFTGIFNACSHAGLVEDGCQYFRSMRDDFSVVPSIEHYDCILDLLGRAGHLSEATDLLQTVPNSSTVLGRTSLLTGCRTYGNTEIGRHHT